MSPVRHEIRVDLTVSLILTAALSLLAWRFWFVTDDAYISFRYARNWVLGHGLVFNIGESPPIEGYSNFLWVMLSAGFEALRADVTFWGPLVSAACGAALLVAVYLILRKRYAAPWPAAALAALTLAIAAPFGHWCSSGLETMAFAALVFGCVDRLILRPRQPDLVLGCIFSVLIVLIRIDGIAWVALILLLTGLSRWARGELRLSDAGVALAVIGSVGTAYWLWRGAYFGGGAPTSVMAKWGGGADFYSRGAQYVIQNVFTNPALLTIIPGAIAALRPKRRAYGLPVILLALAFPDFSVITGGDFMAFGRFMLPMLPLVALTWGWFLEDCWTAPWPRAAAVTVGCAVALAAALPAWNIHSVPRSLREAVNFRRGQTYVTELERWRFQAQEPGRAAIRAIGLEAIGGPRSSTTAAAIGAAGYYTDLYIYDRCGIVSPEVARNPADRRPLGLPGHDRFVEPAFFLDRGSEPTFVASTLLRADAPPAEYAAAYEVMAAEPRNASLLGGYVLEVVRLEVTDVAGREKTFMLFYWRRIDIGISPADAWQTARAKTDRFVHTGELRAVRIHVPFRHARDDRGAESS